MSGEMENLDYSLQRLEKISIDEFVEMVNAASDVECHDIYINLTNIYSQTTLDEKGKCYLFQRCFDPTVIAKFKAIQLSICRRLGISISEDSLLFDCAGAEQSGTRIYGTFDLYVFSKFKEKLEGEAQATNGKPRLRNAN